MNVAVVAAIFKRNFVSYFSSPIGYVFICALVLLSAFAAFWPNEFFNSNLANLDQLNRQLPWILLVFIPAVTMSVWAGERQHGTDELLLTLPARDLDVVIGKYLASLAIFTVALVFSMSNIVVLVGLGSPDLGLLAANYVGYWLAGAAMLSVGMVASFLTGNLTVAFILAVAFNAPLVFAAYADVIHGRETALVVKSFSVAVRFGDFGRGVISLSGVVYFASIVVLMLYVSMVLIRRRHWAGKRAAVPMSIHYVIRVLALAAVAVGVNTVCGRFDRRLDITSEKLSSLSPQTRALLDGLGAQRPIFVEAFISPEVPESYVQTRLNLLSMLREVDSLAGDRVIVRVNPTEVFSETAQQAQEQFGITARSVQSTGGGKFSVEEIYLGAAFLSGLDKVVVPFFDRGIPAEYEVVRSITTVAQETRKRIGVVMTDARLFGGFDMQTMSSRPSEQIINELNKQYETDQVNAASPISDDYDALLVVQPSSLPAASLDNLIGAVARGVPTAIFEDPFPFSDGRVAATSQPRVPPGGNNPFMQRQPPEPKGNIGLLWNALGVEFSDREIVRCDYNPFPKLPELPPEMVFVARGSGATEPFNEASPITGGLQQVLLMFPGFVRHRIGGASQFTPLLQTGTQTAVVSFDDMIQRTIFGSGGLNPNRRYRPTRQPYTLAARIRGPAVAEEAQDAGAEPAEAPKPAAGLDVVLASDIDMLYSVFFVLRERGSRPEEELDMNFDNVTFVLNVLDELSGDDRFLEIRKRRPAHRTLTAVEERTGGIIEVAAQNTERFKTEFDQKQAEQRRKFDADIQQLQQREGIDLQQMALEVQAAMQANERRLEAIVERLERERDQQLQQTERDLALEIRKVQDGFKFVAVAAPPILPLVLAVFVFGWRRRLEKIGVPAQRLRGGQEHGQTADE
ncbi:MAG: Gldg family protein [Planctomycetota bacterium]|jgi:ABC-2 type transport system permease protein